MYDSIAVEQDDRLSEGDIRLANKIVARIPGSVIKDLMQRSAEVNDSLSKLPANLTLSAPSEAIPWDALGSLFQSVIAKNVRLARATKILHMKRPNLIPILDSVVVDNYTWPLALAIDSSVAHRPEPLQGVEYCMIIKTDLDANMGALTRMRARLEDAGIRLSLVRILDILLWTRYS